MSSERKMSKNKCSLRSKSKMDIAGLATKTSSASFDEYDTLKTPALKKKSKDSKERRAARERKRRKESSGEKGSSRSRSKERDAKKNSKSKSDRKKSKSPTRRAKNIQSIIRSSVVSLRVSRMTSNLPSIQEHRITIDKDLEGPGNILTQEEDEFDYGNGRTSVVELYALRDALESVSGDRMIDRQTMISHFEINPDLLEEYGTESGKNIDGNALLADACMDMVISSEEKLKFLFDLCDVKDDGMVPVKEVTRLFRSSLSTLKLETMKFTERQVYKILYKRVDVNGTGFISFDDFCSVFHKYLEIAYPELGETDEEDEAITYRSKFMDFYEVHGLQMWWLMLYFIMNAVTFVYKYFCYEIDPAIGLGLRIARGSAQVVMLNCLLVLLPMCRGIIGTMKKSDLCWKYFPLDDCIAFHKLSGAVALGFAIIHAAAHVSNVLHLYILASPEQIEESVFGKSVPEFSEGVPPFGETLLTLPIWTGVILIIITLISFPVAIIPKFRKGKFHIFWYTHMLLGVWLILAAIHGMKSWLATSQSYLWITPPLMIYLIERRFRYGKFFTKPVRIARAEMYENTLGLFMHRPARFAYQPGMYLYLNVPALSRHEWHPFTISSSPEDEYISLHIRNAGDWTNALIKLMESHIESKKDFPIVYLDGPVGAPTTEYRRFKTVVMVGAGIGVTPFASIMKDLVHRWKAFQCNKCQNIMRPVDFKIEKMYFYWTTRGQESLSWFESTMNDISSMDSWNALESHQYLTTVKDGKQVGPTRLLQALIHDETGCDIISGLHSKQLTHFGRPDWDQIFTTIKKNHSGEEIGVFYCGPHTLEKILQQQCLKYSSAKTMGTHFDYHSEKFS